MEMSERRANVIGGRARIGGRLLMLAAALVFLASCATTRNARFVEIDDTAQDGSFQAAAEMVDSGREDLYSTGDRLLYYLDSGMLHFYAGNYDESVQRLTEAEFLIEELFTVSVSQATATFILNDTVQDYSGEDFEDIYLNVFKSIAFLDQGASESAFVEARRINNKLNLLEDKYVGLAEQYSRADEAAVEIEPGETRFYNSALGRYLSLMLYRGEGDWDGARIDYQEMQEAFREQSNLYDFPMPFDRSVSQPADQPRLSVLSFTGRAPIKTAETLRVVTAENWVNIEFESEDQRGRLVPQQWASFPFPGVEGGYRFVFRLPRMQLRGSDVDRIRVMVDGRPVGELSLLEDIERIAQDTFSIRQPLIFLKTVTRAIVKGVAAERGKEGIDSAAGESGSALGTILGIAGNIATDVAVEASEQADLRVSRYFPAYAHAAEFELPEGTYNVDVEYYSGNRLLFVDRHDDVQVGERGVNIVASAYPR